MNQELTLSPKYSRILVGVSQISLLTAIIIYFYGHPQLVIVPGAVYCSSVLYWIHPIKNSIRRKIDIGTVAIAFTWQKYIIISQNLHTYQYWIFMGIAVLCYPLSNYCRRYGEWADTTCHALIHIFANIANLGELRSPITPPLK